MIYATHLAWQPLDLPYSTSKSIETHQLFTIWQIEQSEILCKAPETRADLTRAGSIAEYLVLLF